MVEDQNQNQNNQNQDTSPDATSSPYINPSQNIGPALVLVAFNGVGYRSWRRCVLRGISVKNKMNFINGKSKRPALDDPTYEQWVRCDDMVTLWILNSPSRDIADSLQYVNNARELWQELKDMYDQTNSAKRYQLQKKINDLSQGTLDITR
ncbi:uncharacterized protein LOC132620127 [Lycium barbarum]|uniref:uncharacterized protein LOC132620127 n=1 Tax=Lycium barbarum TaxID=112863 RepID=UPI00293ED726|nr:uncharacterized protein LOC132620127 [Lycium barbarum]